MTNLAHIVETGLLLLAAYLFGCMAGYATRRILHAARGTRRVVPALEAVAAPPEPRRSRSPAARLAASVEDLPVRPPPPPARPMQPAAAIARKAAPEKPAIKPPAKPRGKTKPATLTAPRNGGADNLKQIKGIGPKIEASLHALGVFHIDQIAGWSKANIDWVEAQLAFKGRIRRERWVEQAVDLGKVGVSA